MSGGRIFIEFNPYFTHYEWRPLGGLKHTKQETRETTDFLLRWIPFLTHYDWRPLGGLKHAKQETRETTDKALDPWEGAEGATWSQHFRDE